MQAFQVNVPTCGKMLTLKFTKVETAQSVWRYQIYATNQITKNTWFNLLSDNLSVDTIDSTCVRRNLAIHDGDNILIRAGRFGLHFEAIGDFDLATTKESDVIRFVLPAIVTAYVDERWKHGVNKLDAEMLNELQASVHCDTNVAKLREEWSAKQAAKEPKVEPKPEAKVETKPNTFVIRDARVELVKIEDRATDLDEPWQFSVLPAGVNPGAIVCQSTIFHKSKYVNMSVRRTKFTIRMDDVIQVELKKLVIHLKFHDQLVINELNAWLLYDLVSLMRTMCEHTRLTNITRDQVEPINIIYSSCIEAFKAVAEIATKTAKVAETTKVAPKQKTKYLMGLARSENILGIDTVRFGVILKRCVLDLVLSDYVSAKNMEPSKFGFVRVKRNISRVITSRVELIKVNATFRITDGRLSVMTNEVFIEYYITYNGKFINSYPNGIDFEFTKTSDIDE